MPLRCDTIFEKGGEKSLAKGGLEPGSTVLKDLQARILSSAPLEVILNGDSAIIQWGKKVFSQPPIVQVLPLKKMRPVIFIIGIPQL